MSAFKHLFRRDSLLVPDILTRALRNVKRGAYPRITSTILHEAAIALHAPIPSILDKSVTPPSGDKRDFISLSIYYWPNPSTVDGLPYVYRDGQVNPECANYDRQAFVTMVQQVEVLTLAYALQGDERFAERAARVLRSWFLDPATGMYPRMLFAQYIPGNNVPVLWPDYPPRYVPGMNGRGGAFVSFGGVIEDLHLVPLTDCIRLLEPSPHWTDRDRAGLRTWYSQYADWLLTHQHGLDEAACRNNHGSWYWADIACFLEFTGRHSEALTAIPAIFPTRLDLQVAPDGSQPEELGRAVSMNYTAFGLCSFTNIALSAARVGYDVWQVVSPGGRTLRSAVDWFVPYLTGERAWTWPQFRPFDEMAVVGSLAACAARYPGAGYDQVLRRLPFLPSDHPLRLAYDIGE